MAWEESTSKKTGLRSATWVAFTAVRSHGNLQPGREPLRPGRKPALGRKGLRRAENPAAGGKACTQAEGLRSGGRPVLGWGNTVRAVRFRAGGVTAEHRVGGVQRLGGDSAQSWRASCV